MNCEIKNIIPMSASTTNNHANWVAIVFLHATIMFFLLHNTVCISFGCISFGFGWICFLRQHSRHTRFCWATAGFDKLKQIMAGSLTRTHTHSRHIRIFPKCHHGTIGRIIYADPLCTPLSPLLRKLFQDYHFRSSATSDLFLSWYPSFYPVGVCSYCHALDNAH